MKIPGSILIQFSLWFEVGENIGGIYKHSCSVSESVTQSHALRRSFQLLLFPEVYSDLNIYKRQCYDKGQTRDYRLHLTVWNFVQHLVIFELKVTLETCPPVLLDQSNSFSKSCHGTPTTCHLDPILDDDAEFGFGSWAGHPPPPQSLDPFARFIQELQDEKTQKSMSEPDTLL